MVKNEVHPIRDGISLLLGWAGVGWMLYTDQVNLPILGLCAVAILGTGALNLLPYLPGYKVGTPPPSVPSPEEVRGL